MHRTSQIMPNCEYLIEINATDNTYLFPGRTIKDNYLIIMNKGKSVSKPTNAFDIMYTHSDMITNAWPYAVNGIGSNTSENDHSLNKLIFVSEKKIITWITSKFHQVANTIL